MSDLETASDPLVNHPSLYPGQLYIAGSWRDSSSGERADVIDPSTGNAISTVAEADLADVDLAVESARTSFEDGRWAALPGRIRARVLHKVADLMRERADELVAIESADVGKPVTFCRPVDVLTAADQYEYSSALAQTLDGSVRNNPFGALAYTQREPYGVVAAITPFNFPLVLSTNKIAPALAAGNSVIHKPAPDTPLSAIVMAQIFSEAGVPDGVVNVLTSTKASVADALVRHSGVDKIAFTGSTGVGRLVASAAGQNLTSVSLELGGNGAQILFDDADLERALPALVTGATFNSGQFCMGAPRVLVARPLYDIVVARLVELLGAVVVGDPFDPDTQMGPMAGERHVQNVERFVAGAREDGADVVLGGRRLHIGGGFYYEPTIVVGAVNSSQIVQEEVFGPVVTIQAFDSEAEAVMLANSTAYGLAAGFHTTDVDRIPRVASALKAGIVWVNDWALLDPAVPFGGVKNSGFGRENGPEALESFTKTKSVVISLR
ncbi:aldehyde dehydrogenase family protein [Subtercola sp. RTI3]|uniref:aldehyde dehydrogenase family protein n=1 Tax=Subtercola sp. RTI3 TaxID=3048639 RepID=UPI002B232EF0|nr:aldehyde dehydrogenase family protein [Subtercola sp. RTI3]MEA9986925.1 aldehyde dehydrogenase family protein [Subtercola sp. RTI3]